MPTHAQGGPCCPTTTPMEGMPEPYKGNDSASDPASYIRRTTGRFVWDQGLWQALANTTSHKARRA